MNPPDELDGLPDQQLNELFAVEVAGWSRNAVTQKPDGHPWLQTPPPFCADANSVLPWVIKHGANAYWSYPSELPERPAHCVVQVFATTNGETNMHEADSPTFARSCVLALLRQARAKQEAAQP